MDRHNSGHIRTAIIQSIIIEQKTFRGWTTPMDPP